ncbi:MAG TPA: hypothetical protein DCL51_02820 [Ruthenibacterium lactatiformans]|uniref:Uncharacterized protein n=1 Tax=Ruthenibacterium lactatiformans TaxID=1550024 RepID=A0A0D8J320_9FIRM|nr:hypothetical protein TQ39_00200 [Ruthenibacterium lactatiformans]MBD9256640.1 hypothetical protein [Ruthenibacterium lactatiformans]RGD00581.1 hypothetical protein DW194_01100 [Subdoligranulum sp. AM16-9]HAG64636.1 hypothetical protein [Ruthenibacterium lactatiformans]
MICNPDNMRNSEEEAWWTKKTDDEDSIARNFTAKRLAGFCEKWHSTHTFCNNYEIIAEDKTFIIQRL